MTGLHDDLDLIGVPGDVLRQVRKVLPALIQRITTHVQRSVRSYAGPAEGKRRRLIEMAVTAAVTHFVDSIEQPTAPSRRVDELFRRMGHGEATEGHDMDAMQAAFRIANNEAWEQIRSFATEHALSAELLGHLGDALFAYIDHLAAQTELGYDGATRVRDQDPGIARVRLADGLLTGAAAAAIRMHAAKAAWVMPSSLVVLSVDTPGSEAVLDLSALAARHLVRVGPAPAVIVCDSDALATLLDELRARPEEFRVATSWPVTAEEVPDALRWTTRALQLVTRGVIPESPLIDCAEHRTQLWLHSEPQLRQRLCQDLLRPLLAETPNSREILSETLLAWLESRDSAPAIAARLGVHPQTVRYRWKRINELFGDDLQEPEFVVQVTMLLKASVPLWKAGDQSDFERFRTEDAD